MVDEFILNASFDELCTVKLMNYLLTDVGVGECESSTVINDRRGQIESRSYPLNIDSHFSCEQWNFIMLPGEVLTLRLFYSPPLLTHLELIIGQSIFSIFIYIYLVIILL